MDCLPDTANHVVDRRRRSWRFWRFPVQLVAKVTVLHVGHLEGGIRGLAINTRYDSRESSLYAKDLLLTHDLFEPALLHIEAAFLRCETSVVAYNDTDPKSRNFDCELVPPNNIPEPLTPMISPVCHQRGGMSCLR